MAFLDAFKFVSERDNPPLLFHLLLQTPFFHTRDRHTDITAILCCMKRTSVGKETKKTKWSKI